MLQKVVLYRDVSDVLNSVACYRNDVAALVLATYSSNGYMDKVAHHLLFKTKSVLYIGLYLLKVGTSYYELFFC